MNELLKKRTIVSALATPTGSGGPVDFNATGDKFIYTPVVKTEVYRYGFVANAAMDPDAGGFVLALDHRPTAGSDTNRTEKATITRTDTQTVAAGGIIYRELDLEVAEATGDDGVSIVNVGPAGPVVVNPGEELVIEVTNAVGAASTGYVFIEVVESPFDLTEGTEVTS